MTYTVTLEPDHTAFSVLPGETVLAAALRHGINLPHSCQSGICGQCKAQLLAGNTDSTLYITAALSDAEKAQGKILTCCTHAASDLYLAVPGFSGAGQAPVKNLPARVESLQYIGNTAVIRLALPKNSPFVFLAGQYIDIQLKNGASRSYSIANAPHQTYLELHIRRRENGLFSEMLFGAQPAIGVKSILRIRGPLGSVAVDSRDPRPLLLLATGTGYAPVQSLLQQLAAEAAQRPLHLYWGAAHAEDLYAQAAAAELIRALPHARFTPVLSRPDAAWTGATGYVQDAVLRDYPDLSGHQVYACGSSTMIVAAQELLCRQGGLPADAFVSDAFTPAV